MINRNDPVRDECNDSEVRNAGTECPSPSLAANPLDSAVGKRMNKTMYPFSRPRRFFATIASTVLCVGLHAHAIAGDMVVWYKQPAQRWTDASPLGNGLTAAMVFGGTKTERIALNNSSFWSGRPHDYDDPNTGKYFNRVKALMREQKFQEAEKMVDDHFYGSPTAQQAY